MDANVIAEGRFFLDRLNAATEARGFSAAHDQWCAWFFKHRNELLTAAERVAELEAEVARLKSDKRLYVCVHYVSNGAECDTTVGMVTRDKVAADAFVERNPTYVVSEVEDGAEWPGI